MWQEIRKNFHVCLDLHQTRSISPPEGLSLKVTKPDDELTGVEQQTNYTPLHIATPWEHSHRMNLNMSSLWSPCRMIRRWNGFLEQAHVYYAMLRSRMGISFEKIYLNASCERPERTIKCWIRNMTLGLPYLAACRRLSNMCKATVWGVRRRRALAKPLSMTSLPAGV